MKKILLVSEQYPMPDNSGTNQRTMLFARSFSDVASVDLVYSNGNKNGHTVDDLFKNEFRISKGKEQLNYKKQISLLLKGIPWCIQSRYSREYEKRLFSLIDEQRYDIIFIRYLYNVQYFINAPKVMQQKIIIDVDDVFSGPLYSLLYKISTKYRWKEWFDYKMLKQYEENCIKNMGKSLFCSKEDASRIHLDHPSYYKKTFVIPNIVNPLPFEEYTFCDGYTLGHTLLFVGTLNYMPNVEGLEWFINSVFLPFRGKFQDAKLLVVGKNPKETILKLCETEGVELHANVPDVRPYYARSRAVVVPLLKGGGTRIKILEATLTDRPVISTPIGAEGLNFVDGLDILLFKDSDSFISQYLLLQKMDFYDGMARMAKERTQLEYSPQKFKESINKVLEN